MYPSRGSPGGSALTTRCGRRAPGEALRCCPAGARPKPDLLAHPKEAAGRVARGVPGLAHLRRVAGALSAARRVRLVRGGETRRVQSVRGGGREGRARAPARPRAAQPPARPEVAPSRTDPARARRGGGRPRLLVLEQRALVDQPVPVRELEAQLARHLCAREQRLGRGVFLPRRGLRGHLGGGATPAARGACGAARGARRHRRRRARSGRSPPARGAEAGRSR